MRLVVIADTHLRDTTPKRLPPRAVAELERADVILHAGDLVEAGLLEELQAVAPTHAVLGNNDVSLAGRLPEVLELELEQTTIGMIHDAGPRAGREARLRRRFPDADLVVFGHSHIPWNAPGIEGQHLLNPGSATQRRAQPHRTIGVVELEDGRLVDTSIVVVD